MATKSYFFNSVDGDRVYNAEDIASAYHKFFTDGVFATPATCLQVTTSEGMTVEIDRGWGMFDSKEFISDAVEQIEIDAAHVLLNRIDTINVVVDYTQRSCYFLKKTGAPASTPIRPERVWTTTVKEYILAEIFVGAGKTAITQHNITDKRSDVSVCGYIVGRVDVIDTTDLFMQYDSAFAAFMATLEETLSGDVAGNLLMLIENHKNNSKNPHNVTKSQVGLEAVENIRQYSANNKPTKSDVGLGDLDNIRQYSTNNKPPYPVTSVCGKTGDVSLVSTDIGATSIDVISTLLAPSEKYSHTYAKAPKAVLVSMGLVESISKLVIANGAFDTIYAEGTNRITAKIDRSDDKTIVISSNCSASSHINIMAFF